MLPTSFEKNVALIGAGYWGKNLARNFNALGALHTICDSEPSTLQRYGADYAGVEKTTDCDAVLANAAVTRVAIATPAVTHYAQVRAALLAGKDVMVEKPLCVDESEGRKLVELAENTGRILMVGHLLQYHPCIQKLQALLAQGELGKLHYVTSNRLNLGKIRREENALWSFAPHDISVILSLTGNQLPEKVCCMGEAYLNQGVADTTFTAMRFPGGIRAHAYVNWLNPFKEQKLTVVGSNGMVVFDDTRPWNDKLVIYRQYLTWTNGQIPTPNNNQGEPLILPEAEPLREECVHFLSCCAERRAPRTDGREGLRVLQVLQAAQRSLEKDGEAVCPKVSNPSSVVSSRAVAVASPSEINLQPSTLKPQGPRTDYYIHPTAVVDDGAEIGAGTKIWHFVHVLKGAHIGKSCVLGQNVNVDGGAKLGNNVKVQNNVSIYSGVVIEDDVFLGPSCVLTNVSNPRSQVNRHRLYETTRICRGATVGANATIVCGVTLGCYCFVGAGAVVTRDVPDYALVVGNPARQEGWMSRHGHPLRSPDETGIMVCPESGFRYREMMPGLLKCLDLDEEACLPSNLTNGARSYRQFKEADEKNRSSAKTM